MFFNVKTPEFTFHYASTLSEARYIKLGATFLGPSTPFQDYLGDYKPEDSGGGKHKSFDNFDHRRYSEDMLAALQDN